MRLGTESEQSERELKDREEMCKSGNNSPGRLDVLVLLRAKAFDRVSYSYI